MKSGVKSSVLSMKRATTANSDLQIGRIQVTRQLQTKQILKPYITPTELLSIPCSETTDSAVSATYREWRLQNTQTTVVRRAHDKVDKRDRGLMELSIQENRFAGWSRLYARAAERRKIERHQWTN